MRFFLEFGRDARAQKLVSFRRVFASFNSRLKQNKAALQAQSKQICATKKRANFCALFANKEQTNKQRRVYCCKATQIRKLSLSVSFLNKRANKQNSSRADTKYSELSQDALCAARAKAISSRLRRVSGQAETRRRILKRCLFAFESCFVLDMRVSLAFEFGFDFRPQRAKRWRV